MNLAINSQWEHSHYNPKEGQSHLVITIRVADDPLAERAPIDLAFALDRSGSMNGPNKIELVKQAVVAAVDQLQDSDRAALVVFDNQIDTLHDLTPLDADHRRHLEIATRSIYARGATNLSDGWMEAARQLQQGGQNEHRIQRTLLLTDGRANHGITNPSRLATHASELREGRVTTSAIGVGRGFDEMLLSRLSESGGGNFQYIAEASELEAFFSEEIRSLGTMVAMSPFLDISLPEGMRAELINAFPHDQHRNRASVDLRDLSAGEEVHLVFGISSRRVRSNTITPDLHLHWKAPSTGEIKEINEPAARIAVSTETPTRNDNAAVIVALEHAAREHREAIQLDREGRYQESRDRFRHSYDSLMAAPDSIHVQQLRESSEAMANHSLAAPMDEHTRKQTVHSSHMRSRGRRDHSSRSRRDITEKD